MLLNENATLTPLQQSIINELLTVYDPEIPVNIYDLGLIYDVQVDEGNNVVVVMSLTAPNCPAVDSMIEEIQLKTERIEGVASVKVKITFDPPWDVSRMSEEAKLMLGWL